MFWIARSRLVFLKFIVGESCPEKKKGVEKRKKGFGEKFAVGSSHGGSGCLCRTANFLHSSLCWCDPENRKSFRLSHMKNVEDAGS